ARALGYDRVEELIGTLPRIAGGPAAQKKREAAWETVLREGMSPVTEGKLERKDGTSITIESAGKRITYNGRTAILGIGRDVTERRRAQEELVRLTHQLTMAEESERRRVAQDLHDSVSQTLSLIKLELGSAVRALGLDPMSPHPLAGPLGLV